MSATYTRRYEFSKPSSLQSRLNTISTQLSFALNLAAAVPPVAAAAHADSQKSALY